MRSRNQKSNSRPKAGLKGRIVLFGLIAAFLFFTVGLLALSIWVKAYLRSEAFQKLLSQKTASFLKAEGSYRPLSWSGFSVYSDGFEGRGKPGAVFTELQADQLRAELNLNGLFHHAWQIDQLDIQRLQVTFGEVVEPFHDGGGVRVEGGKMPGQDDQDLKPEGKHPTSNIEHRTSSLEHSTWLPDHLDLRKIVIQETDLSWGNRRKDQEPGMKTEGGMQKVHLIIEPEGQALKLIGKNGQLYQESRPSLDIESFKARFQQPQLFITDAQLRMGQNGTLGVSGDIRFEKGPQADLMVKFKGIEVTPLLPDDWRARLKGNLQGEIKVNGPLGQPRSLRVSGPVRMMAGQLEALPVLDKIAAFTNTQQFRRLVLQKASANFAWSDPRLEVTQLHLESEGLLCVEGECVLEQGMIDGHFQVGVTPSSLGWLQGVQSRVFTVKRDGYFWAPMRLTGPADHPSEDLSARLESAAVKSVIEAVPTEVRKTAEDIFDKLLKPLLK